MYLRWKYFLLLLWLSYMLITGVLLFIRGFLLSREVQPQRTGCKPSDDGFCNDVLRSKYNENREDSANHDTTFVEECVEDRDHRIPFQQLCPQARAKVVLIVIDALKYDFIYYSEEVKDADVLPYQNKLTVVQDLLQKEPNHTKLFKFIADPPTTTMQRLKGLTTGSLPTFIDIGSNFASPEINEDNLLDQLQSKNKSIVFMGDDTWSGLYPQRFLREYAYPSFNVWDLDTVDNGIVSHLLPEIQKGGWDLLIAHFLGVDHCGHRYGPYHPEMERKLMQMNEIIRSVVDTIDDNTMLFIIGDHGMTSTGDHGGDSEAEVTSALFVFSPKPLLSSSLIPPTDTIKQVDLVPTLAAILGIAIPFSNLGTVVLDALPAMAHTDTVYSDWQFAVDTLWRNVEQVSEYIEVYSQRTDQFSREKLLVANKTYNTLKKMYKGALNLQDIFLFSEEAKKYLSSVREMCEEVWVEFDAVLMAHGLLVMVTTILFSFLAVSFPKDKLQEYLSNSLLLSTIGAVILAVAGSFACYSLGVINNIELSIYQSTGLVSLFIIGLVIISNWVIIFEQWSSCSKVKDWPSNLGRILLLLSSCALFSNSYVVEEARMLLYFMLTLVWLLVYNFRILKSFEKQSSVSKSLFYLLRSNMLLLTVIFSILIKVSEYYWLCREEQKGCESLVSLKVHASTSTVNTKYYNTQCLITLVCFAFFVTVARIWLRSCGNLVGFSPIVTLARYAPTVIVVCTGGFWVLQGLPKDMKSKLFLPWQIQFLPWIIYALIVSVFVSLFFQPLSVYAVPKKTESMMVPVYGQANIIPHLFNHMKDIMKSWSRADNKANAENNRSDLPIVYGLATLYSSVYVNIGVFTSLLVALLLGDALAPSVLISCSSAVVLLVILSTVRYENAISTAQLFSVPWSAVLCWGFLTMYFFYGTGHNPTFPGIHWEAAFVGTGGQFSNHIVPALLICCNTFASHILLSFTLPLLLIAPFTIQVMFPKLLTSDTFYDKHKKLKTGELVLYENEDSLYHGMFNLSLKYITFFSVRMFACMLAATVHCRHLMVWKIFAPKLIFEGIGLFITLPCVLLSYLLLIRITLQVNKLLQCLEKEPYR